MLQQNGGIAPSRQATRRAILYVCEQLERRLQLAVSLALSGTQTITAGSPINASDDSTALESEMSVAVNPTNPLNIAGFTHHLLPDTNVSTDDHKLELLCSTDGGATWSTNIINADDDGFDTVGSQENRFDPTLTFDDEGRLYICYGVLDNIPNTTILTNSLIVGVDAEDGGASVDDFSVLTQGSLDKWFIASGRDPSTNNPAVYVAYTNDSNSSIDVTGTNDGGSSWLTPIHVSDSGHRGLFGCPAVDSNGAIYISWHNVTGYFQPADTIWFDRDLDGLWASTYGFGTDISARTLPDEGLIAYHISAAPSRGVATAPILAVDHSGGTYNNRLYLTFIELNGSKSNHDQDTNVRFGYSSNGGTSWTYATIDSSTGSEFLPWIDVDQTTGQVSILYYTTDGDQNIGNDDVHMRLATSIDGGSSWTLSDVTTITSNQNQPGDIGYDYLDYIGLDVHEGTASGFFSFQPFGTGADENDLDAVYVNLAFASSSNTLTITGDDGGTTDDTITVQRSSANSDYLDVVVNGSHQFLGRYDTVRLVVINGGGGNDTIAVASSVTLPVTINGGDGLDTIDGGGGSDVIDGGADNDTLRGNAGVDTLTGGTGSDSLDGGAGDDAVFGGDGNDTLVGGAGTGTEALFGNAGDDVIRLAGGNYTVDGGTGADTLDGAAPASVIVYCLGGSYAGTAASIAAVAYVESVSGSAGNDLIDVSLMTAAVTVHGNNGNDTITGSGYADSLFGDAGNDSISGAAGADTLNGSDGNDTMRGGDGNDSITAGKGDDLLYGDDGDDIFWTVDADADTIFGGNGNDTAYVVAADDTTNSVEQIIDLG